MNIKVSVIIPTRERAETLDYCLKTALKQNAKNYQVIVSDNYSSDNTKEIVESYNDNRIEYINPGKRLGMTDHWNYAIEYAKGEYVIIIGDDDGIMPYSIDKFIEQIEIYKEKIYTWPSQVYFWPSKTKKAIIPYVAKLSNPKIINLDEMIRFVHKYGLVNYSKLPHFYHSAVHRDVIKKIKEDTGKVFNTAIPDVYMSYILPAYSKYAINLGYPISIVGHSPKSNSGSLLDGNIEITNNFFKEYKNIEFSNSVPQYFSEATNNMLNTYFIVRNYCNKYYKKINYKFSRMIAFQYVTLKIDSIKNIYNNKGNINNIQKFNFIEFIIFIYIFKIYIYCRSKFSFNKKEEINFDEINNVSDFTDKLYILLNEKN